MEILPADEKRLIVNADDFGQAASINRGIVEAHQKGIVTSASLLANGDRLDDALEKTHCLPNLGLGIHLSLVFGKPVSPPDKIPSLLSKGGDFARGYSQFAVRYMMGRVKLSEVQYEWEAQREKLDRVEIYHIDSHQHLHLLPGLFRLVVKLAKKWGIRYIRVPLESIHLNLKGNAHLPMKVLNSYAKGKKSILKRNNLKFTDFFFGSSFSGGMIKSAWEELIPKLPKGLTEVMCHPGREDAETRRSYGWKNSWERELEALTDPELKWMIEKEGIILTNFRKAAEF
ncbi:MAG: ChbG/HpnK family deacetylase [candidate division Zixibacteria bacterium]|nr:ChbG/HpnK family deacetylase [Candidatus Tariuqbacter arcticus]